jgi:hypothetical protein
LIRREDVGTAIKSMPKRAQETQARWSSVSLRYSVTRAIA